MAAAAGALSLTGCASIIGDDSQTVSFISTPSQAQIAINDEKGRQIVSDETPATVTLEKSDGSYWGGKTYNVSISKTGYETQSLAITSSPNGWYIAGNLVFGGLIGWFIVDPFSGAMYSLSPDEISADLGAQVSDLDNGAKQLHISLLKDIPQADRGNLRYLGQI